MPEIYDKMIENLFDGLSYLHMVEAVHMQMSIAMMSYFCVVGCSILCAQLYMKE